MTDPRQAEYVALLRSHEWGFEFSPDVRVWQRGFEQFGRLNELRRAIDRDYALWNRHCPPRERRPPPAWRPGQPG